MIRYADDFAIGVAREDDTRRIMEVLSRRPEVRKGLFPEKSWTLGVLRPAEPTRPDCAFAGG